jgi:4-hydroxy-tetrahydrodipicolinate reductase
MVKIILVGSEGVMGKVVKDVVAAHDDFEIVSEVDVYGENKNFDESAKADIIIEFSHFSQTDKTLDFAEKSGIPAIIATTALTEETKKRMADVSKTVPIFYTANMSLGINVLAKVIKEVSPALSSFDTEIIEKHHNKKKDAPSGTAILLADSINEDGSKKYIYGRHGDSNELNHDEIGIHAVRGGTLPGEHAVLYLGNDEVLEFKHTAYSKKVFAEGALKAATFLISQKSGLYDMQDVIG